MVRIAAVVSRWSVAVNNLFIQVFFMSSLSPKSGFKGVYKLGRDFNDRLPLQLPPLKLYWHGVINTQSLVL